MHLTLIFPPGRKQEKAILETGTRYEYFGSFPHFCSVETSKLPYATNLRELRAELRKLGLPTTGLKRELEQRLAGRARSKVFHKVNAAGSMEGIEDEEVQGAEKPAWMKEVRTP
jgi:hypothetical protein